MTRATDMITAERERHPQLGYDAEHDSGHARELVAAADCYVEHAGRRLDPNEGILDYFPMRWPWAVRFWKPRVDPVRTLVKAAALIAAAIDAILDGADERAAKDRAAQALTDHERVVDEEGLDTP